MSVKEMLPKDLPQGEFKGALEILSNINLAVRIGIASTILLLSGLANAQIPLPGLGPNPLGPFTLATRAQNPLRQPLYPNEHNKPTAVDLDKDGDLDLVFGSKYSGYRYFRNDGNANTPLYVELIDTDNPFYYVEDWSAPAFADLDKDGDLDMFTGEEFNDSDSPAYGSIHYFVNKNGKFWTETSPGNFEANEQRGPWNPSTKAGNPAHVLIYKTHVMPTFADVDKDGDPDLLVSTDFDAEPTAVSYFINDGNGNLAVSDFVPHTHWFNEDVNFGDVDGDGDMDMVIGDIDGLIHFFSNNGAGVFTEQTGAWNPASKTGDPFNGLAPSDYSGGYFETSLTLADFNGDGRVDALVGFLSGSSPYFIPAHPYFLRNNGQGVLEKIDGLLDPAGGIQVDGIATVDFQDINNDGQLDAITSGIDGTSVDLYNGGGSGFTQAADANNPFNNTHLGSLSDGVSGQLVDFDKDGDLDFVITTKYGAIKYYKNANGNYTLQPEDSNNPFNTTDLNYYELDDVPAMLAFADIDADNDVDVFVGSTYGYVDFFRNDNGVLVKRGQRDSNYVPLDNLNPLGSVMTPQPYYGGGNLPLVRFVDLDHDGDFDAIVGFSTVALDSDGFITEPNSLLYYENTGTAGAPVFTEKASPFNIDDLAHTPGVRFIDFDKDGDLDAFVGIQEADGYTTVGHFRYFINTNPSPVVVSGVTTVTAQPGASTVLDANFNLTDQDNDVIVGAEVTIQGFEQGKEDLTFTQHAPVTGSFNTSTGKLTLSGRGTVAEYASVLKTIAYRYSGTKPASGGRKGSKTIAVTKNITIAAIDADQTLSTGKTIGVQVSFPNASPAITASGKPAKYLNTSTVIDNGVTITDADDATLASATIKITNFIGQEDFLEFSSQNGINGSYNSATGMLVLTGPSSVANYQAALRSITYKNVGKSATLGNRIITFQVNDGESNSNFANATVSIDGDIVVYNALSANGDNLNPIFFIQNIAVLEPENQVTIFDRWGAKVYDVRNYDNSTKVFTGHSNSGSELPTGVYFYRIEFLGASGRAAVEGFLAIRR